MAQNNYKVVDIDVAEKLLKKEMGRGWSEWDDQLEENLGNVLHFLPSGEVIMFNQTNYYYAIIFDNMAVCQEMIDEDFYPIPNEINNPHFNASDHKRCQNIDNHIDYYLNLLFTKLDIPNYRNIEKDILFDLITKKINKMTLFEDRLSIFLALEIYIYTLRKEHDNFCQYFFRKINSGFNKYFEIILKSNNNYYEGLTSSIDKYLFTEEKVGDFKDLLLAMEIIK